MTTELLELIVYAFSIIIFFPLWSPRKYSYLHQLNMNNYRDHNSKSKSKASNLIIILDIRSRYQIIETPQTLASSNFKFLVWTDLFTYTKLIFIGRAICNRLLKINVSKTSIKIMSTPHNNKHDESMKKKLKPQLEILLTLCIVFTKLWSSYTFVCSTLFTI